MFTSAGYIKILYRQTRINERISDGSSFPRTPTWSGHMGRLGGRKSRSHLSKLLVHGTASETLVLRTPCKDFFFHSFCVGPLVRRTPLNIKLVTIEKAQPGWMCLAPRVMSRNGGSVTSTYTQRR